jgi:phosphopantetheine adenylyltransferase
MAIDVTKGISHLEHMEDLSIIQGSVGIQKALDSVKKFLQHVENQATDIIVSTKIDGAPSVYFGKTRDGKFFVSTKSIFNKEAKMGYSLADIQRLWTGDLVRVLSNVFQAFKPIFKDQGKVLQGDLLFSSSSDKEIIERDGSKFISFQPNVIRYAIPVDNKSDIYRDVKVAQVGMAIHGLYDIKTTKTDMSEVVELNRLPDKDIRDIGTRLNKSPRVFVIDPFIDDLSPLKGMKDNINEIRDLIISTEQNQQRMDKTFDNTWTENAEPALVKIKTYLSQFINQQIRLIGDVETIFSTKNEIEFVQAFKKNFEQFLSQKQKEEVEKRKSLKGKERVEETFQELLAGLQKFDDNFTNLYKTYFRLLSIKNLMVEMFDEVEDKLGQSFLVDRKNDYALIATKPEGYVILNGPNMVKIVDRAVFSKNNLLYSRFQESVEDKKKSLKDDIYEDVLNSFKSASKMLDELSTETVVESLGDYKDYGVIYIGRFQPPTIAHVNNIVNLSKMFGNVYVLLSNGQNKSEKYLKKNPFPLEDRIRLLKSDSKLVHLTNVSYEGGLPSLAFGLNNKETEQKLRELFDFENDILVLAVGKEEDRYFELRGKGVYFDLNKGEQPSEDKPFGLYGIELEKETGSKEKISATDVRNLIFERDLEEAKEKMAGSESRKDEVLERLIHNNMFFNDDYRRIQKFDIEKELTEEKEESISQEDALDLLMGILEKD